MNPMGDLLVLGLGNSLLGDDAVGPWLVQQLAAEGTDELVRDLRVQWLDGGTIGLALLPAVQDCAGLIAVDAAQLRQPAGTVAVLEGEAMDAQLGGQRHSAHEVALGDLMAAAALCGALPARRALVAVQPEQLELGRGLSAPVQQALPALRHAVLALLQRWHEQPEPTHPDATPATPVGSPKETCHV